MSLRPLLALLVVVSACARAVTAPPRAPREQPTPVAPEITTPEAADPPPPACMAGYLGSPDRGCMPCPEWMRHDEPLGWCTSWAPALPVADERAAHTATVLADGRVLVVGGTIAGIPTATTSLFDPATDAFSDGPALAEARSGHTATRLADGRVLVAGGVGGGELRRSIEAFDGATWSSIGALREARTDHAAALLPDGRVLIVGGTGARGPLASVEVVDPAGGTSSRARPLPAPRAYPSAHALADGTVLVIGGDTARPSRGARSIGSVGAVGIAEMARYTPSDGRWTAAGSLPLALARHAATLVGDHLFVVARPDAMQLQIGTGSSAGTLVIVDTRTSTSRAHWIPSGDSSPAIAAFASGAVIAWGVAAPRYGERGGAPSAIFVAPDGAYTDLSGMLARRRDHTLTALADGRVIAIGGTTDVAGAYRAELLIALQGPRRGLAVPPDDPRRPSGEEASALTLARVRAAYP